MDNDVKPDFPTTHVVVGGYPLFSFWMTWETQQPKRETTALRGKIEARIPYYGQNEPSFWTMFRPHLADSAVASDCIYDPEVLDFPAEQVLSVKTPIWEAVGSFQ